MTGFKDLYFLTNFNNYYNRIVKKKRTLEEYASFLKCDPFRVNFNPGDGINAKQDVNSAFDEGLPDYLVVTDGYGKIESLWFVLDCNRLRNGQYSVTLKRDVVAENLDLVLDSEAYMYKGYVKESNPLIYNMEGISVNQIKKSERKLMDYTNVPWIVGYISPDAAKDAAEISGDIEGYYDKEYNDIQEYPFYNYFGRELHTSKNTVVQIPYSIYYRPIFKQETLTLHIEGKGIEPTIKSTFKNPSLWIENGSEDRALTSAAKIWKETSALDINSIMSIVPDTISDKTYNSLVNQDGRVLKIKDKFYKISLVNKPRKTVVNNILIGSKVDRIIQNVVSHVAFYSDLKNPEYPGQKMGAGEISISDEGYELVYKEIAGEATKFKYNLKGIDLSNEDTPYGIICMPYSDRYAINNGGSKESPTISKAGRLKIMQALGSVANLLSDIQILPYCPIVNLPVGASSIEVSNPSIRKFPVTNESGAYLTSILIAPKSTFSFKINESIILNNIKEANELCKWRLCSPNYASSWEFNASKFFNGSDHTVIKYFNIDCCYRPFTPYIHVAPNFSGLYGQDFNDARGLICGGDFSIDRISDNWETYQYNNKNFQLQFDRQIESMELSHKWNMASAAIGAVGNGVSAGIMGGLAGGPMGAGIGIASGILDAGFNTAEASILGRDRINAAKDQFNWNLQNIQAQPYNLTKVSTLNQNNKVFPFIEYYTCSFEETKLFRNKIKYEGMTINAIDKPKNYINTSEEFTYIKAMVLRLDNLSDDSHLANEINNELLGGVYIYD